MKPQFTRQASRGPSLQMYRAAARKLRAYAADLDLEKLPVTPQERRQLTRVVLSLARSVRVLRDRHTGNEKQPPPKTEHADRTHECLPDPATLINALARR